MTLDKIKLDQIKGALYGVAVGDALGGTTEFMSAGEVSAAYGYLTDIIGGGVWRLEPGEVTDDTMMTLCVAEGILDSPDSPMEAIGERFLAWYKSDPKDIGNIIRHVLGSYDGHWFEAAYIAHMSMGQSAGNGSLMRCLPVALCYTEPDEMAKVTVMQSRMTHYDQRCDRDCLMYNRIAFAMLNENVALRDAIKREIAGTEYEFLLNGEPGCEPSGYIVHTTRWVLHLLLTSESYEEVVQRAANQGGDSDTIAAIAGGLAGIHYGYNGIPKAYTEKILIKDKLDEVVLRIMELRGTKHH